MFVTQKPCVHFHETISKTLTEGGSFTKQKAKYIRSPKHIASTPGRISPRIKALAVPILIRPPYYVPITFLATCAITFSLVALMQRMPGLRQIV